MLDDIPAIVENPHIRTWPPSSDAIGGRARSSVSGRPLVAWTLALNYAMAAPAAGTAPDPRPFHYGNLAIHIAATLALFGVVRRTLATGRLGETLAAGSTSVATAVALLWTVHPLLTGAVTYIVQRAESLMSLCLLLTLYCAIRARDGNGRWWRVGAVAACAAGMGAKEVMVVAPLLVIAWDWHFTREPWNAIWRRRWPLYAALIATWAVLAVNVWSAPRAGAAGFGFEAWPWWRYLVTQAGVILHYLRLAIVPVPLVIDYGWPAVASIAAAAPAIVAIAALEMATLVAVARRHPAGFAGALFFLVLAPTSSVLPIVTEVAAEHRMYLPLAAVIALVVTLAVLAGRRLGLPRVAGAISVALVAATLGALTLARNRDYASEERIWETAVRDRPSNPRARINYGVVLLGRGNTTAAEPHLRKAVELAPDDVEGNLALGATLCSTGRCEEGVARLSHAAQLDPANGIASRNAAEAHASLGRRREAAAHFRRATALLPQDVFVLNQASWLFATAPEEDVRDGPFALMLAERAVAATGGRDAVSLDSLAAAYAELGRFPEAAAAIQRALAAAEAAGDPGFIAELRQHEASIRNGRKIR